MLKKKWNFETLFSISDGTVFEINKETVEVFFDKETVSVDPNDNYQKKDYLDRSKSLLFHELVVIHNLRIANKCWLNKKRWNWYGEEKRVDNSNVSFNFVNYISQWEIKKSFDFIYFFYFYLNDEKKSLLSLDCLSLGNWVKEKEKTSFEFRKLFIKKEIIEEDRKDFERELIDWVKNTPSSSWLYFPSGFIVNMQTGQFFYVGTKSRFLNQNSWWEIGSVVMTDRIINDSKPLSLLPEYNQVKAEKCAVVSFLNPIPTDREKFFYPITSESEKKYLDYLSSFLDDLRNNFQNPSFFFFFPPEIWVDGHVNSVECFDKIFSSGNMKENEGLAVVTNPFSFSKKDVDKFSRGEFQWYNIAGTFSEKKKEDFDFVKLKQGSAEFFTRNRDQSHKGGVFYNKVGFLFGKDMIYLDPFQFSRGCNYVRERIEFIVEVLNFPPERIILIGNQASSSVVLFGAISSKYKVKVLSFGAFFPQPFFPNYWRKIVDFSSLTKEQKDMEIILYRNSVYDGYVDPEIKKNFGISDSLKNPRDNYLIPPVLTDKLHQKLLDEGFTNVKLMSCDTNDGFDFELVKNNLHSSKFVQSFEDKDGMLGKKHDISKKVFFFLLGVAFIFPVILSLFFLSFFQLKKQKRKSLRIKSHL